MIEEEAHSGRKHQKEGSKNRWTGKKSDGSPRRRSSHSPTSEEGWKKPKAKKSERGESSTGYLSDRREKISAFKEKVQNASTASKQRPKTSLQPVTSRVARDFSEGNEYRKFTKQHHSIVEEEIKRRPKSKYMES